MRYFSFILFTTACTHAANAAELAITVTNIKDKPAADMVVFAEPKSGIKNLALNSTQLVIDQKGKKFSPYVTVMQKGQNIEFSNKDDITHHIYSVSGKNRFDFKLQAGAKKVLEQIKSSEEIAMGCNIHDWMSGFVLVVDTPYYGKTNHLGQVTLQLDKLDEYTITIWHPQLDSQQHRMSVFRKVDTDKASLSIKLTDPVLPIPEQVGQEEFEFLEEY